MDSLREMGLTMGEFAEKLINSGQVKLGDTKSSPVQKSKEPIYEQLDISNTKVPDSFMKKVLGEKYSPQQTPNKVHKKVIKEEVKVQKAQVINEEKVDELISLLTEVKELLQEMTTVGNLGVNLAGPKPTEKPKTKKQVFTNALRRIRK